VLPDFIVAGASKAGTTWLSRCLGAHPEVFVALHPTEYFSYRFDRGLNWYEGFFSEADGAKRIGEKSTSYMIWDETPGRIADALPDVTLLFVLREPVARANSHYRMLLRAGNVTDDIDAELVPGTPLVEEGRYFQRLNGFRRHLADEQVRVLLYDDLIADPAAFIRHVYGSLGVSEDVVPPLVDRRFHATKTRPRFQRAFNSAVRASIAVSSRSRLVERGIDSLRQRGVFDVLHRINRGPSFPTMSDDHRRDLVEYYRDDVEALAGWLGRDLSHWTDASG
jgi:hypothetical protein